MISQTANHKLLLSIHSFNPAGFVLNTPGAIKESESMKPILTNVDPLFQLFFGENREETLNALTLACTYCLKDPSSHQFLISLTALPHGG